MYKRATITHWREFNPFSFRRVRCLPDGWPPIMFEEAIVTSIPWSDNDNTKRYGT